VSSARFWHFVVGLLCLGGYLYARRKRQGRSADSLVLFVVAALPALYVGSALPDWDIALFSIGAHRNPLFHSALPYFFAGYVSRQLGLLSCLHRVGAGALIAPVQIGFALGLGSHLLLDILQYGDVRWIPGGTLDRLWLGLHTGILLLVAWYPQDVSAPLARLRRLS
jgi:hypothetical protein